MRIRKCASKLLGLARPPLLPCPPPPAAACSPHWPPPTPEETWESSEASTPAVAEVLFCQLNCSPWDVMADLHLLQKEDEGDEGIKVEEEKEEKGRNIVGGGISVKDEPMSPSLTTIHSESNLMNEGRKKANHKKMRRKKEEVQTNSGSAGTLRTVITCKKTDGKGWHCKRPAHLPHTLCHYHLDQLRSYSCNGATSTTGEVAGDGSSGRCRRTKKPDVNGADSYYYYYSGFGPWRGKTRGGSCSAGGGSVAAGELEEDERETSESTNSRHEDDDDNDPPEAGGDEESINEDNGMVHDEGSDGGNDGCDAVNKDDDEEHITHRKRGRKAVKARSLKSLL